MPARKNACLALCFFNNISEPLALSKEALRRVEVVGAIGVESNFAETATLDRG
jgi:hypothetical protein